MVLYLKNYIKNSEIKMIVCVMILYIDKREIESKDAHSFEILKRDEGRVAID